MKIYTFMYMYIYSWIPKFTYIWAIQQKVFTLTNNNEIQCMLYLPESVCYHNKFVSYRRDYHALSSDKNVIRTEVTSQFDSSLKFWHFKTCFMSILTKIFHVFCSLFITKSISDFIFMAVNFDECNHIDLVKKGQHDQCVEE